MRIPLISTLESNSPETKPFPGIDSTGQIQLYENDGSPTVISVDSVECRDFLSNGKSEINFWLDGVPSGSWDILITDQRIAVFNRFSKGFLGKPKVKNGKVSAGHIYYGAVSNLSTFMDGTLPVLLICCYRGDGTRTAFTMKSTDQNSMKKLAVEFHDRIESWIVENGRKLSKTDGDVKKLSALKKWNEFRSHLWIDSSEYSTFVPCKSWDKVPDSRIS